MAKKVLAAVLLIGLFAVAIVQAVEKDTGMENRIGIKVGEQAPDFELELVSGEKVKLSDYRGKKVMLNFWATWCPPCKAEMPVMEQLYKASKGELVILAVNMDTQNDVAGFVSKNGITFPILLDKNNEVNKMYQVLSIPTSFFIDSKGVIRNQSIGLMQFEEMEKYTKDLN